MIFAFNDNTVRQLDVDGEPWFVAVDVCRCLGLGQRGDGSFNATHALRRLDDDEKGVKSIHSLKKAQMTSIVSEPGLFKLIARSTKPEAKEFDRWVRHEVLPAIRKTVRYLLNQDARQTAAVSTVAWGAVRSPRLLLCKRRERLGLVESGRL